MPAVVAAAPASASASASASTAAVDPKAPAYSVSVNAMWAGPPPPTAGLIVEKVRRGTERCVADMAHADHLDELLVGKSDLPLTCMGLSMGSLGQVEVRGPRSCEVDVMNPSPRSSPRLDACLREMALELPLERGAGAESRANPKGELRILVTGRDVDRSGGNVSGAGP